MHRLLHSIFSPTASFQILSDLHLEVGSQYSTYEIPPSAPYLILAGDIGRLIDFSEYAAFLERQIQKFEQVYLVLGNHEFYGLSYADGVEKARELVADSRLQSKVNLLDREAYAIFDRGSSKATAMVLGCTLWSRIPDQDAAVVSAKVKDFQRIIGWSVDAHNATHKSDLSWLRAAVRSARADHPSCPIVVVTHHAPCKDGTSLPDLSRKPWSSAFATDVLPNDDDDSWEGLRLWVFGHTHYSCDFKTGGRGGVRVVANQRGYVLSPASDGESGSSPYDPQKVVRV